MEPCETTTQAARRKPNQRPPGDLPLRQFQTPQLVPLRELVKLRKLLRALGNAIWDSARVKLSVLHERDNVMIASSLLLYFAPAQITAMFQYHQSIPLHPSGPHSNRTQQL